jgi:plastocyanin
MNPMRMLLLVPAAAALLTVPVSAGEITGKVRYAGASPAPRKIVVTKDEAVCGKVDHVEERLVVGADRGIRDVVVNLVDPKSAPPMKAPQPNVAIDQNGCRFMPRVQIVPAGAPVDLVNDDGILHNIRTWSKENPAFNRAQPKFKKVMTETFAKPEIFRISCDVHSWMEGWVVVAGHAWYALTDTSGSFRIPDVAPGTYTIRFWQEKLGTETRQVTVPATGAATVDLTFPAK